MQFRVNTHFSCAVKNRVTLLCSIFCCWIITIIYGEKRSNALSGMVAIRFVSRPLTIGHYRNNNRSTIKSNIIKQNCSGDVDAQQIGSKYDECERNNNSSIASLVRRLNETLKWNDCYMREVWMDLIENVCDTRQIFTIRLQSPHSGHWNVVKSPDHLQSAYFHGEIPVDVHESDAVAKMNWNVVFSMWTYPMHHRALLGTDAHVLLWYQFTNTRQWIAVLGSVEKLRIHFHCAGV